MWALGDGLMGVLLYYPTVNPPTEIVHQALLYWDGLASVVPRDPRVYQTVASEELRRLEGQGLYRPLAFAEGSLDMLERPADSWSPSWLRGETSSFLAQELRRIAASPNPPRPTSPPEAVLYTTKASSWLQDLLVELGLVSDDERLTISFAVSKERFRRWSSE